VIVSGGQGMFPTVGKHPLPDSAITRRRTAL
jgi:hypothetical protein